MIEGQQPVLNGQFAHRIIRRHKHIRDGQPRHPHTLEQLNSAGDDLQPDADLEFSLKLPERAWADVVRLGEKGERQRHSRGDAPRTHSRVYLQDSIA